MTRGVDTSQLHVRQVIPLGLTIICIVAISLNLRPGIVSISPLLPLIQQQFSVSNTTLSLLIAIPDLLMGALALPAPWLARRFGRDRVILGALVLLGLSIAARAFAPSIGALLMTTAGIGAGIAVAGALIGSFVKASFPSKAALLMGIYATALGVGSTLAAAATGMFAELTGGWTTAAGMWSIPVVFAVVAWRAIKRRADDTGPPAQHHHFPVRTPMAWLTAAYFAADNFLFYALLSWLVPLYVERGASTSGAGFMLAALTGCCTIGSLLFGILSCSEDRRLLLGTCAILALIGVAMIGFVPGVSPLVAVSIAGLGIGGGFALGMTLPLDQTRDPDHAATWGAFVLLVGYLIAATGPILVGLLKDITHDFAASLWLLTGIALVMLVVTPFLRPLDDRRS